MFLKSSVSLKQEVKCSRIIDFIRILYTVPIDTPEQRLELALKLEKKFNIDNYGFDRQEKYKETRTAEDIGIMVYRTYMDVMHPENFLYYKKIKHPIDSYLINLKQCCNKHQ